MTFKSGSGSTQFSYDRENDKTFTYVSMHVANITLHHC